MHRVHAFRLIFGLAAFLTLAVSAMGQAIATDEPALNQDAFHHVAQVLGGQRIWTAWSPTGSIWACATFIAMAWCITRKILTYRGNPDPATVKQATGRIGNLEIIWIQPQRGGRFWRDGLLAHGDGIRVLNYEVDSPQQFDAQVAYFGLKGAEWSWKITGKAGTRTGGLSGYSRSRRRQHAGIDLQPGSGWQAS